MAAGLLQTRTRGCGGIFEERAAIVVLGIGLVGSVAPAVSAQTRGEVRGEFVRLVEKQVGDRVVVEPFHFKGNALTVVEELRKAD